MTWRRERWPGAGDATAARRWHQRGAAALQPARSLVREPGPGAAIEVLAAERAARGSGGHDAMAEQLASAFGTFTNRLATIAQF